MRKNNLGFLPLGVQVIIPLTVLERQLPAVLMMGVFPFGDQVRLTVAL
jgi:hypothetical protein